MSGSHALLGYFTDKSQSTPAVDPGLEVACPVCAKPLSRPMVTTSFLVPASPSRAYFFRAHKACWDGLDEHEQGLIESAFVDAIAFAAGRIVPLYDADLNPINREDDGA